MPPLPRPQPRHPRPPRPARSLPRVGSSFTGPGTSTSTLRTFPPWPASGYDWAWSGLDRLFLDDDLTLVNLECSPSSSRHGRGQGFHVPMSRWAAQRWRQPESKSPTWATITLRTLARKHCSTASRTYRTVGMAPVGAGRDGGRRRGSRPSSTSTAGGSRSWASGESDPTTVGSRPTIGRAWQTATRSSRWWPPSKRPHRWPILWL